MAYERIARIYVGKSNHDKLDLLDIARRQVDHFGRDGISAKRGQTNRRFLQQGYLRFPFPTRAMRRKFAKRVAEFCDPAVRVRFYRKRR